jgi:hypothetical protein
MRDRAIECRGAFLEGELVQPRARPICDGLGFWTGSARPAGTGSRGCPERRQRPRCLAAHPCSTRKSWAPHTPDIRGRQDSGRRFAHMRDQPRQRRALQRARLLSSTGDTPDVIPVHRNRISRSSGSPNIRRSTRGARSIRCQSREAASDHAISDLLVIGKRDSANASLFRSRPGLVSGIGARVRIIDRNCITSRS